MKHYLKVLLYRFFQLNPPNLEYQAFIFIFWFIVCNCQEKQLEA